MHSLFYGYLLCSFLFRLWLTLSSYRSITNYLHLRDMYVLSTRIADPEKNQIFGDHTIIAHDHHFSCRLWGASDEIFSHLELEILVEQIFLSLCWKT